MGEGTLTLWEKLIKMGFVYKEFEIELTFTERVKNLFGANIRPRIRVSKDWLVKVINGKTVDVYANDIWYTTVSVNGEVIFDDVRFDDKQLFDAIEEATEQSENIIQ